MGKLQGQAFDTEKFYGELNKNKLEEYAIVTGLFKDEINLDSSILLDLVLRNKRPKQTVLEVGCGYGRIGKYFLGRDGLDYFGIDLHKPYINSFKENIEERDRWRILEGNFLTCDFPFERIDSILFSWSVIADFDIEGQKVALHRSHKLLVPEGKIYVDVPKDVINRVVEEFGPFNVHEVHDLSKIGLMHINNHQYQTYTGRIREIIEIKKCNVPNL